MAKTIDDIAILQRTLDTYKQYIETGKRTIIEAETTLKAASTELTALKKQCKTDFGCDVDELPDTLLTLEAELDTAIADLKMIDISCLTDGNVPATATPVAPVITSSTNQQDLTDALASLNKVSF